MNKKNTIQELASLGGEIALETAIFQEKVAAKSGLSVNDMRALSIIMKHDGINATALSKKLGVTNGAVTGIVERLGKKNLIYKKPSEQDQRSTVISANYAQIATNSADYQNMGAAFQELLGSYDATELAVILDYNRRVLILTKEQSARASS